MEPITAAIVAALLAGAAAGTTEVGKNALVDAYKSLKGLLAKKFGEKKKELPEAVAALEANPESKGRQLVLQEEIETVLANNDPDVIQAVQALVAIMQQQPQQAGATGVKLKEIETKLIEIKRVIATGTGVDIQNATVAEGIHLENITAGHIDPNA